MKEILFRAWIEIEEWKGYYYPKDENKYIGFIVYQDEFDVVDCNYEYLKKTEFVIEQYTGLKDKNGVKIFDKDICKNGDVGISSHGPTFEVDINNYYDLYLISQLKDIEIIGNIHDKEG